MSTFKIRNQDNKVDIFIDNIIHLSLKKDELIGFQSWIEGVEHKIYYIEFYMRKKDILAEYDKKSMWIGILKLLGNENLFKDNF